MQLFTFHTKAQAGLEALMILGFIALIAAVFLMVNQESLDASVEGVEHAKVEDSLTKLQRASSEVYGQGAGTQKQITIDLPRGVSGNSITGNAISIDLVDGDTYGKDVGVPVNGSLPIQEGRYQIDVEAKEGFVQIKRAS